MIRFDGISKAFGPLPVVRGVTLTVNTGECYALLGANGSGKSTLLRIAAGLVRPDAGTVTYGDIQTGTDVRRKLGLLSHESFCYPEMSPLENLSYYASLYALRLSMRDLLDRLEEVGMYRWAREPIATFSRGMQQRVALARSILHDPEYMLLDEAFSGLDKQGVELLNDKVHEWKQAGKTVLLVTHQQDRVDALADRYGLLDKGKLVEEGKV